MSKKQDLKKAYKAYVEMMLALGNEPNFDFDQFVNIHSMYMDMKDSFKHSWGHIPSNKNHKPFNIKPKPNNKRKEPNNMSDKDSANKSPQVQINEALDKIQFLQAEINKYKSNDKELTESLVTALNKQKNKINKITNNGKQIKGLFNNEYYINHIKPNN